jgi:RimJ/RimL family protein N-acetyltransferase
LSHLVVTNDEGQYSTWPNDRPLPAGWHGEGFSGDEEQCLDYIGTVWTDLRPHSLRDLASAQPTVLAADDVIVREMSADEVAALLDEEAVSPAWAPGYPLAGGRAGARNFGQRPAEERKPGFGPYHIVRLADGLVVGDIGFHAPPADGAVEVGFSLAECARGNGYATKAVNAIVTWALSQPGVDRVVARTLETNRPSQHVLARAGFGFLAQKEEILQYERAALVADDAAQRRGTRQEGHLVGRLVRKPCDEQPSKGFLVIL